MNTVGILIPEVSGIQMVDLVRIWYGVRFLNGKLAETILYIKNYKYFFIKWSRLINHLKTGQNVRFLNGTISLDHFD